MDEDEAKEGAYHQGKGKGKRRSNGEKAIIHDQEDKHKKQEVMVSLMTLPIKIK